MNSRKLTIRTVEGVEFALPLATPVARALAWGLDFLIIFLVWFLIGQLLALFALISFELSQALQLIGVFVIPMIYNFGFEWFWRGQTPGKRALRLRVVDAEGLKLRPSQIILRNLLRAVDALPALNLLGGIVCFFHHHYQRLGDLAANTVVIRIAPVTPPNLASLQGSELNSLRQHPHLAARLRQKITAVEAQLALQALNRREEIEPEARIQLFATMAERFRVLVHFPPETTEGLTDEQYVRNTLDILYRPNWRPS
jgi:uncharacterized RDD family membrane protein YckC